MAMPGGHARISGSAHPSASMRWTRRHPLAGNGTFWVWIRWLLASSVDSWRDSALFKCGTFQVFRGYWPGVNGSDGYAVPFSLFRTPARIAVPAAAGPGVRRGVRKRGGLDDACVARLVSAFRPAHDTSPGISPVTCCRSGTTSHGCGFLRLQSRKPVPGVPGVTCCPAVPGRIRFQAGCGLRDAGLAVGSSRPELTPEKPHPRHRDPARTPSAAYTQVSPVASAPPTTRPSRLVTTSVPHRFRSASASHWCRWERGTEAVHRDESRFGAGCVCSGCRAVLAPWSLGARDARGAGGSADGVG